MADAPLSELVIEALETALQSDGEVPLIAKGKTPGLLPAKSSPDRKKAIEICQNESLGLFTMNTIKKGKTETQFATITQAGIEILLKQANPIHRSELIEKAAEEHRNTIDTVALHLAEDDLNRIADEQQRLSEESKQLSEMMIRLMDTQFDVIRKNQERLEREAEALQAMKRPEPIDVGYIKDDVVTPRKRRTPSGDEEIDFQTQMCRELVYAWQDSDSDDARQSLERVMINSGLEEVGATGDSVQFDAKQHITDDELLTDQPATVVSPGWMYESERGTTMICKIKVEALRPLEVEEPRDEPYA